MTTDGAPVPTGSEEIADRRAEFARRSRADAQSPREFVEHKIEIVASDPDLSDAEKAAAIAELRRVLRAGP